LNETVRSAFDNTMQTNLST